MDCEFDKVKLESLWEALSRHGVSGHTFRVLQADKDVWCVPRIALESGNAGVDFQDGKRTLLDLSFADDILLFAKTFEETQFLLDELMIRLPKWGYNWVYEKQESWQPIIKVRANYLKSKC